VLFRPRVGVRFLWAVFLACSLLVLSQGRANAEDILASWYGPGHYGLLTASGEPYDASGYTASHETLPFGTELEVGYKGKVVVVTVNDRGGFAGERKLGLSQAAAQELGLTESGVDYVQVDYPNGGAPNADLFEVYPLDTEETTNLQVDDQAGPLISTDAPPEIKQANTTINYGTGSLSYPGVGSIMAPSAVQSETKDVVLFSSGGLPQSDLPRNEVSQNEIPQNEVPKNEATRGVVFGTVTPSTTNHQGFVAQPNAVDGTGAYPPVQPYGIDPSFIGRQEGFRLDAYVPDPVFSSSGVTVGTGVDIGQRSVADIQALGISEALKQKLIPYAGLKGQGAMNFLANRPLRLTEDEAYALDGAIGQEIFGDVATLYDATATGNAFSELPLEAKTAIGDVAYQYGANLPQRLPDFWGDVTQGRWDEATQSLKNFGDRYPARRTAEAALLEQAIGAGELASYVVQPGDTLAGVALRLGTSVEDLASRNGLANPGVIQSGQALRY
jgi:hypothetical protein